MHETPSQLFTPEASTPTHVQSKSGDSTKLKTTFSNCILQSFVVFRLLKMSLVVVYFHGQQVLYLGYSHIFSSYMSSLNVLNSQVKWIGSTAQGTECSKPLVQMWRMLRC